MQGFSSTPSGTRGRIFIGLLFVAFIFFPHQGVRDTLHDLMVEAYIGVSVFIVLTLSIVSTLENLLRFNLGHISQTKPRFQILIASFLGALPGCGGAIMVVTYYLRGQMCFGAVVAALTATMGDAAFLLLSKKPLVGLSVISISFIAAIATGYLVQLLHSQRFDMKLTATPETLDHANHGHGQPEPVYIKLLRKFWWLIAIPGVSIGVISVFPLAIKEAPFFQSMTNIIGILGAGLTIGLWVLEAHDHSSPEHTCHRGKCAFKVIESDTSFITFWVIVSFIMYNLIIFSFGVDLTKVILESAKYFLPLVAILIGFIPGCGPQIIVATLYIQGVIPFSAQIGNAISTDGDALFPALAMAPRASFFATIYSAVPAVIIAYGYLFLFE